MQQSEINHGERRGGAFQKVGTGWKTIEWLRAQTSRKVSAAENKMAEMREVGKGQDVEGPACHTEERWMYPEAMGRCRQPSHTCILGTSLHWRCGEGLKGSCLIWTGQNSQHSSHLIHHWASFTEASRTLLFFLHSKKAWRVIPGSRGHSGFSTSKLEVLPNHEQSWNADRAQC